jgi:hypothetical protein
LNIYEKLQKARVELQKSELKKTGHNTYSNYYYFELGDFLHKINELMFENKFTAVFDYKVDPCTLTLINYEKVDEQIVFSMEKIVPALKACNELQNVGGSQTFIRRYLYIMAFEISEQDLVSKQEITEEDELKMTENIRIDKIKLGIIKDLMAKAETSEESMCKYYEIKKVGDITNIMFSKVVKSLENTIDKKNKALDKQINALDGVI